MLPLPDIALVPMLNSFGSATFGVSVGAVVVWMLIAVLIAALLGIVYEAVGDRKTTVNKPVLLHLERLDAKQPRAA